MDEVVRRTAECEKEYARIKCSYCYRPGPTWINSPYAIDVVVEEEPVGCHASASFPRLLRSDLYELLSSHLPYALVGECRLARGGGLSRPSNYVTVCAPEWHVIDPYRGPYCRHEVCPGTCARIRRKVYWAKGAIVERDLDDRLVYLDAMSDLFIDGRLAKSLDLKGRFPDIVLKRYPIIPEPLDGDTLPGDPGWDGVFREQPAPKSPKEDGEWVELD